MEGEVNVADLLPIAKGLTTNDDPDVRALADWVIGQLEPNGEPVPAVEGPDGLLSCSHCGNDVFGYLEGCVDYRTPGEQDPTKRTVSVVTHIDGTAESGDSKPGLFCDNYRAGGCGRPVDLPFEWEIDFQ